jgi:beta-glucosidase
VRAAFPHGFGLSYTTFTIGEVAAREPGPEGVRVAATVTNTGRRDGHHVVQVYGRCRQGGYPGELMLVGFAAVAVAAETSVRVEVPASFTPLARWDTSKKARVLPAPSDVELEVGACAHDPSAVVLAVSGPPRL